MKLRIIIGLGVSVLVLGSCEEKGLITEKPKPTTISSVEESNEESNVVSTTSSVSSKGGTDNKSQISDFSSGDGENGEIWEPDKFAGGAGTKEDPYQIATAGQLELVRENLEKHFIVTKDIDLRGIKDFEPIGNQEVAFQGTLDGDGKKIKNLRINRPEERGIGLFRQTALGSIVKNVKLEGVDVRGGVGVGGLAGRNSGTIENSHVMGKVKGIGVIGGLVGVSNGTIENSHSTAKVVGRGNYVGGLLGVSVSGGSITENYATGSVEGNNHVGGLVGSSSSSGTIANSYATGAVTGRGDYVGGLVGGLESGTIANSRATGQVTGRGNYVGGLVGLTGYSNHGTIQNSYATGAVTGTGNFVGGLVGQNGHRYEGRIQNSYATGNVKGNERVGGLVGCNDNTGKIQNSYATGNVRGNNHVGGLAGLNGTHTTDDTYYATIQNSYATGRVTGPKHAFGVGGFVGTNINSSPGIPFSGKGVITGKNYWKAGSSARGVGIGGRDVEIAKTTDRDFKALDAEKTGWSTEIWEFEAGKYPRFKWQN